LRAFRRVLIGLFAGGLAAVVAAPAGAWCDVVFKDVAQEAEVVLLGRIEKVKGGPTVVRVADILKGQYRESWLSLDPSDLDVDRLKHHDHVLVALDGSLEPLRQARGLGFCQPISVLPIRGGKLRSRERVDYDSLTGSLTLDAIRDELVRELGDGSRSARLSGS